MTLKPINQERVFYRRRSDVPGVEVRSFEDSARDWCYYSSGFEFLIPTTWSAAVWHRRQVYEMVSGTILCAQPGEVFLTHGASRPGAFHALSFDAALFDSAWSEHRDAFPARAPGSAQLRAVGTLSPGLECVAYELLWLMCPGPSRAHIDRAISDFVLMLTEQLATTGSPSLPACSDWRAAMRVRECLDADLSGCLDLATVARHTGLDRFRALRAFKRNFGLPPRAYQLRMRIGLAQQQLREGKTPAQVAARFGFVDQSHLTRHFKRLLGVTPAYYARIGQQHASDSSASSRGFTEPECTNRREASSNWPVPPPQDREVPSRPELS